MFKKAIWIVIISFLVLFTNLLALDEGWESLDGQSQGGEPPSILVINSTNNNVTVSFSIKGFCCEDVTEGGTTYKRLSLPGSFTTDCQLPSKIPSLLPPKYGALSEHKNTMISPPCQTFLSSFSLVCNFHP